jgi:hypothetical protein
MKLGSDDLHIRVVSRQQTAQKVKVTFVQLLLGSDGGIEAIEHRSEAKIGGHLLSDILKRGGIPVFRSPLHAGALQRVFGKHNQFRRSIVGEPAFERRDFPAEDLGG